MIFDVFFILVILCELVDKGLITSVSPQWLRADKVYVLHFFFEFIPLFHPHIFIANVASIPLWIKTNLRRVAQRQSTVGLNSPSIFICCSFCGSKQSFPKSLLHITPDFPHLAVFQQIKHLKDNSSCQNHLVIVGFLGWPYYISSPLTHNDRQKQVEVKRSSRVNPHEIRLFSGCPYAVVK